MKGAHYKTALITGASSGIGETFAHALAKEGSTLILVARSEDKLEKLAHQIRAKHQRRVEVIGADLSKKSPGKALAEEVAKRGLKVDLLINNAGFGTTGVFHKIDAAREQQLIALNCAAVVDLCHAFLPDMLDADMAGIIGLRGFEGVRAVVLARPVGRVPEERLAGARAVPGPGRDRLLRGDRPQRPAQDRAGRDGDEARDGRRRRVEGAAREPDDLRSRRAGQGGGLDQQADAAPLHGADVGAGDAALTSSCGC
jgi:hypothetical protein